MSKDKVKASWDVHTTKLFIDLCMEQVKKGTRKCTSFTKNGWADIGKEFTEMTGRVYNRTQLKNKYDSLRKDWQTWDRLLRETGIGWDTEKNTIAADDDWLEKEISEVKNYEKFKNGGLQFPEELSQLFSNVAATGPNQWAPSSGSMPTDLNKLAEYDLEEGSGDSDEILEATTGMSGKFNLVTLNENSGVSGSSSQKGKGTSGGDRSTTTGCKTTRLLGVRKGGESIKKKGLSSRKIADALNMMLEEALAEMLANEALAKQKAEEVLAERLANKALANKKAPEERADRLVVEEHAYEISIAGVMQHLKQVPEVVSDNDFYARCIRLLMSQPPAREMYVAVKDMREHLLLFLRKKEVWTTNMKL